MSQPQPKFFCGDCKKGYVRKVDFDRHFSREQVREGGGGGGKLIPNICFDRKRRSMGSALENAEEIKKNKTML